MPKVMPKKPSDHAPWDISWQDFLQGLKDTQDDPMKASQASVVLVAQFVGSKCAHLKDLRIAFDTVEKNLNGEGCLSIDMLKSQLPQCCQEAQDLKSALRSLEMGIKHAEKMVNVAGGVVIGLNVVMAASQLHTYMQDSATLTNQRELLATRLAQMEGAWRWFTQRVADGTCESVHVSHFLRALDEFTGFLVRTRDAVDTTKRSACKNGIAGVGVGAMTLAAACAMPVGFLFGFGIALSGAANVATGAAQFHTMSKCDDVRRRLFEAECAFRGAREEAHRHQMEGLPDFFGASEGISRL